MIEEQLSYDDISIIPEELTTIEHRSECNPFDASNMLPIFAAPMSSVISLNNWKAFYDSRINVVIPRNISVDLRMDLLNETSPFKEGKENRTPFIAFSLDETKKLFLEDNSEYMTKKFKRFLNGLWKNNATMHICIDLANGHMKSLLDVIKQLKEKYNSRIVIMSGNIANPKTYNDYEKSGCDYVRCTIGTGRGCLTASNVGVYYPAFSLLKEIYEIKTKIGGKCKIIADGGIDCYRNVQKALIYADYVMIGGLFNQMIESAAEAKYERFYSIHKDGSKSVNWIKTIFKKGKAVKEEDYADVIQQIKNGEVKVIKTFYGMSTKKAQEEISGANGKDYRPKTSEGKVITQEVLYDIAGWVDNEISYLKSAMSYTNSRTLEEYKGSDWVKVKDIKYNR